VQQVAKQGFTSRNTEKYEPGPFDYDERCCKR
jgi:hypothetical protein